MLVDFFFVGVGVSNGGTAFQGVRRDIPKLFAKSAKKLLSPERKSPSAYPRRDSKKVFFFPSRLLSPEEKRKKEEGVEIRASSLLTASLFLPSDDNNDEGACSGKGGKEGRGRRGRRLGVFVNVVFASIAFSEREEGRMPGKRRRRTFSFLPKELISRSLPPGRWRKEKKKRFFLNGSMSLYSLLSLSLSLFTRINSQE